MMTERGEMESGQLVVAGVTALFGALILAMALGWIPREESAFIAPRPLVGAIGVVFLLAAALVVLEGAAPDWFRVGVGVLVVGLIAAVCNWSAFLADVPIRSTTSLGPFGFSGGGTTGSSLLYKLGALLFDAALLAGLVVWLWRGSDRD